jgi:GNAT superfamily N-acetyltransferase
MSLDPEKAENIPRKLIGMYSDTELSLLGMMADAVVKGIDDNDWYTRQTAEALRYRTAAQRLANGLTQAAPTVVGEAVQNAVKFGADAVDADIDLAGHLAAKSGEAAGLQATISIDDKTAKLTRKAVADGVGTLATVNQTLPGAASKLYQQVTARVNATPVSSDLTRRQAVQQALDVLTARGITGFRDNAGRNWSLSTYVEMKSRTLVNNTLMQSHIDRMLDRGLDLVVVSSHRNPAPQCQPFEGQVLSIGEAPAGTSIRPNATGGQPVRVKIKAAMEEARARGFRHPNCRHSVAAFIPGASRTFTTEPDPEGYAATQQLRAMERAIRETKRRQAVAIDPSVKKRLGATLRSQQSTLKQHVDANDLKRRSLRERPDLGYRINPPDALDSVVDVPKPKPTPAPPAPKPIPDPLPKVPTLNHPVPADMPTLGKIFDLSPGKRISEMRKLDGVYGRGLQFKWTHLTQGVDKFIAAGKIYDTRGTEVGQVERYFKRTKTGTLTVKNDFLYLEERARGRGFARDFYATLESWYADSGVARIEVDASLEDGGYAWAKAGFQWIPELFDESTVLDRARAILAGAKWLPALEDGERPILQEAVDRMEKYKPSDRRFPTPQELVNLGIDGKLGERLMRGSSWSGVKKLKKRS